MPDDVEVPATGDERTVPVSRRLVTLISTKEKSSQEAAAEIIANWRKYKESSE